MDKFVTLIIYFFIYSFFGWLLEVVYAFYIHRRFVNRGFLTGPFCPLYGLGVGLVIVLLRPLDGNFILLFIGATIITSGLEYLAGWLLNLAFKTKWWDYSEYKLNLNGYICLQFSLAFGVCATLLYYFVHPLMARMVGAILSVIPENAVGWLVAGTGVLFIADLMIAVLSALRLKIRMREMQAILRSLASELAEDIHSSNFFSERRDDLVKIKRELVERYEWLMAKTTVWQRRLLASFPEATTKRFAAALEDIRKSLANARKKK